MCRIITVEIKVVSEAKGETDNSYRDFYHFAYQKNPNPIQLLYYTFQAEKNNKYNERTDLFGTVYMACSACR